MVLKPRPWRTKPCRHFQRGTCLAGESCCFAHVEGNGANEGIDGEGGKDKDSKQKLAKKNTTKNKHGNVSARAACTNFTTQEGCPFGDNCKFPHVSPSTMSFDANRERDQADVPEEVDGDEEEVEGEDDLEVQISEEGSQVSSS